jgi:hypothetical protein
MSAHRHRAPGPLMTRRDSTPNQGAHATEMQYLRDLSCGDRGATRSVRPPVRRWPLPSGRTSTTLGRMTFRCSIFLGPLGITVARIRNPALSVVFAVMVVAAISWNVKAYRWQKKHRTRIY